MEGTQIDPDSVADTPSAGWLRRMYNWVLHWAETPYALVALALLSFAEASFFPIPPDVLLMAMCLGARRKGLYFAAVCTAASVAGGIAGYFVGALVWEQIDGLFFRYVPGFSPERFAMVRALYQEYGVAIVFTAGFTPIPYKLFTITSGVMSLDFLPFVLASAVGRAGRFFLVAGLIYYFGKPIRTFVERYFNWVVLLLTLLLVGGFLVIKWAA